MCCKKNTSGQWYFEDSTVDNTVDLTRYLMEKYNIPIERVIRHYDVTGKNCPAPYVDEQGWTKFKSKLMQEETEMTEIERQKFNRMVELVEKLTLEKEKIYHYSSELPDWALPTMNKLVAKGVYKGDSESDLNLPESMMRTFVVLDRAGIFDK